MHIIIHERLENMVGILTGCACTFTGPKSDEKFHFAFARRLPNRSSSTKFTITKSILHKIYYEDNNALDGVELVVLSILSQVSTSM